MASRVQSKMARRPPSSGLGMIYFLLMMCAFAEGFLLWVLVALIRESRHLTPRTRKADRTQREPMSRFGELIRMNPGMTQDENAGRTIGKRTVLMVLGALLFTLPLHGQQTASDASDTAVLEGTRSDQPIPPAVMKELEAMKKRIEQLQGAECSGDQFSLCLARSILSHPAAKRDPVSGCEYCRGTARRTVCFRRLDLAQRECANQRGGV